MSGFLYWINKQLLILQESSFCMSSLNVPYLTLCSISSCLERRIVYNTSLLLFLSRFIVYPDRFREYMLPKDRVSFWFSIGNIQGYPSLKILARYFYIYGIAAFDKSRVLARWFLETVIDLEFPFAFLEGTRLFYFSNKDFMSFEIILFDHLLAIFVYID